ncbi:hypothetical protein AAG570_010593 [Ranatra chinensis]|uniref:Fibronectin type-III domain-containing protein n=1 Tax=Ranatra chinensis TaxID=642074 RepID=A0ABD0YN21_9HEMI
MESKRSNMFYENKKQETTEIAPEVPLELTVTKTTETSLGLKWKPPRRANGILRSFLVKIDQTSSYDPEQCCRAFPMKEIQVTEEEIEYSTEVTGLISGSTYAVSVSGVTAWLGPSAMMTASTRPPKPSDIPLPQVHLNIQQPIEWKPTSQEWPGNYIPLIRCNLLLLMTDMVEEKESDLLDVVSVRFGGGEEDEADDDLPPRKEDDVGTLTSLIRKELNGANFKVLALYHAVRIRYLLRAKSRKIEAMKFLVEFTIHFSGLGELVHFHRMDLLLFLGVEYQRSSPVTIDLRTNCVTVQKFSSSARWQGALIELDEDIVLDDIGTGPVATQCGLTADSRTILKTGHKYRLAAVQIVQYKGLYNVAAKITKPFVTT